MFRPFVLLFCLFLFSFEAKAADDLNSTLAAFGFSGRWAVRCDLPPAPDNSTREITISSDSARFVETLGEGRQPNEYRLLAAARVKRDTILLRIELNDDIEQELTIVRRGKTMRTMSNRRILDGAYIVRNGIVWGSGTPTPALTQCK